MVSRLKMKDVVKLILVLLFIVVLGSANLSCSCVEKVRDQLGGISGPNASSSSDNQPPLINTFTADPESINPGESSTLSWDVSGATSVSIDPGAESVPASGSATATLTETTTLTLIATNANGSVNQTVTITVGGLPPSTTEEPSTTTESAATTGESSAITESPSAGEEPSVPVESPMTTEQPSQTTESPTTYNPPLFIKPSLLSATFAPTINSFTAVPENINSGGGSTLSWDVTGATSVSIDHGVGPVSATATVSVSPSTTTTYTLTATNSHGSVTSMATVTVGITATIAPSLLKNFSLTNITPKFSSPKPAINSFTATPTEINTGGNSNLSWNVTGATAVSIDQGVGTVLASGNKQVSPSVTTVYKMTATNSYGSAVASVRVTVAAATCIPSTAGCEQALFDAVNQVRASFGKAPLTRNSYIDEVCRQHAQEWGAAYCNSSLNTAAQHAHDDFPARINDITANSGISPIHCWGENALANYASCDANAMAQGWYNSSHPPTASECWLGHRENMLNEQFTISGMGIYVDSSGHYWAIQIFIGPNPCTLHCP